MSSLQSYLLHLDVSTNQGSELHLGVSAWTRGACAGRNMSTPERPGLHLDVSTPQRPLLHLDVSTPQGPELHLDLSGQKEPVLTLDFSIHHRGLICT